MERKTSFTTGAIALVFLLIGYQTAVFLHKAAASRIAANRDRPDTVYVIDPSLAAALLQEEGYGLRSSATPSPSLPPQALPASSSSPAFPSGSAANPAYPASSSSPALPTGSAAARTPSSSGSGGASVAIRRGANHPAASSSSGAASSGRVSSAITIRRGANHSAASTSGAASTGHASSAITIRRGANHSAASTSGAASSSGHASTSIIIRRNADHSAVAPIVPKSKRRIESFRFDPNTVSVADLQRLGFSEKQALSIDSYRKKGGRFRRPSDFAKSYVVADSVFDRLEPYIHIPKVDLNRADSAAFDALPGIGPYFAAKMVSYRASLRGYSYPEQLMDIYNFDRERFDGLSDLIMVSPPDPYPLWTLPEEELRLHPYIDRHAARSIVLFRENTPPSSWTVDALSTAGILDSLSTARFRRCLLAAP